MTIYLVFVFLAAFAGPQLVPAQAQAPGYQIIADGGNLCAKQNEPFYKLVNSITTAVMTRDFSRLLEVNPFE